MFKDMGLLNHSHFNCVDCIIHPLNLFILCEEEMTQCFLVVVRESLNLEARIPELNGYKDTLDLI